MTDKLVLSEVNALRSEAKTDPETAINNLLNITSVSNIDVDTILQRDVGIHGRLDYMIYLKQQAIDNLNNGCYHYASLDSNTLDKLDGLGADYVTVDELGNVVPANSNNVIEAINDIKYKLKN